MKFFNRNTADPFYDFSHLTGDIHSHILPGLDDGSPDVETSIELIKSLSAVGISRFPSVRPFSLAICTATPCNTIFNNALHVLKTACLENGLDTQLSAAAEYMLDDYFIELLKKKQPLLTLTENYILLNFLMLHRRTPSRKLHLKLMPMAIFRYWHILKDIFFYHKNYDVFPAQRTGFFTTGKPFVTYRVLRSPRSQSS